jgi:hypothetical protein
LKIYAHRAFQDRDELFLGEVAGKLRMLVTAHGQRPLLLDLMDELGVNVRFKLDLPPVQDPDYDKEITLRHYMRRTALGVATGSGFRMLNHSQFVCDWANQYGTAHEGAAVGPAGDTPTSVRKKSRTSAWRPVFYTAALVKGAGAPGARDQVAPQKALGKDRCA